MIVRSTITLLLAAALTSGLPDAAATEPAGDSLTIVVMDPLAAPLSCPCVEGYAQRDYTVLAKHMEAALGRKVDVAFGESLGIALKKSGGKADIVIGKQSVVRADAKTEKRRLTAVSRLTDLKGDTQQYGLIVVNRDDPAKKVNDLTGYTIIFGPSEAEEKHSAALGLLKSAGIIVPQKLQKIDNACSDGACKVIDLGPKSKTAAVISSYAQPLLEGCGTIKKGDLRVVGKTPPVPFVTAFVSEDLEASVRDELAASLVEVALDPVVLEALESLAGFVPLASDSAVAKKK